MSALHKPGSNLPAPRFTPPPQSSAGETVESFLARGGQIHTLQHGEKGERNVMSAREKLRQWFPAVKRK